MNPDKEWPAIRAQLLRMLDGLWIAAAIFAAGLVLAFSAITQQVDYFTFGLFVESLVLIGWIVTRVRFLRHSSSPIEFAAWARSETSRLSRGRF
jgi:hypothetical protein